MWKIKKKTLLTSFNQSKSSFGCSSPMKFEMSILIFRFWSWFVVWWNIDCLPKGKSPPPSSEKSFKTLLELLNSKLISQISPLVSLNVLLQPLMVEFGELKIPVCSNLEHSWLSCYCKLANSSLVELFPTSSEDAAFKWSPYIANDAQQPQIWYRGSNTNW